MKIDSLTLSLILFNHSIRLFLLHQSCRVDARLPVQYHYIYIVRLCSLRQALLSDVLRQNQYKGIYIVLWYLHFHLCRLPNTTSHIAKYHTLQYTRSLLVQTVDARSTYLTHQIHSFLFLSIVSHAQMHFYSILLPYVHLLSFHSGIILFIHSAILYYIMMTMLLKDFSSVIFIYLHCHLYV